MPQKHKLAWRASFIATFAIYCYGLSLSGNAQRAADFVRSTNSVAFLQSRQTSMHLFCAEKCCGGMTWFVSHAMKIE